MQSGQNSSRNLQYCHIVGSVCRLSASLVFNPFDVEVSLNEEFVYAGKSEDR